MIKIAITGDIGSGKSLVASLMGYPVFNADKEVLKIYNRNKNCFKKLKKKLPQYVRSFPIKKKELKKAILKNKRNIRIIEKIVHPIVIKNMKKFLKKNRVSKILVLDIPLFLEKKVLKSNYKIIFVDAKKMDIKKRLRSRKNYDKILLSKLKKSQMSLNTKKNKSDYVIKNKFNKKILKKDVKNLVKNILLNQWKK